MSLRLFIIVLLAALWGTASIAVSVNEHIVQKGLFKKPSCLSDPKNPDYDECLCDADVRYPVIAGLSDAAVGDKLNAWFKERAAGAICEGEAVTPAKPQEEAAKSHMSVSVHYEVTLDSPRIAALKFTDWAYTGGAHGNGTVMGVIADLEQGFILTPNDIFSSRNLEAVNGFIYDFLAVKPEEEIFRDQVEARKGAFIKDNICQGCTLTLTPDGVHVLFQTYEVAPYGAGGTDVLIPAKYIGYAAVLEALKPVEKHTEKK